MTRCLTVSLLLVAGCAPPPPAFRTATAAGRLTYKDKPLANCTLQFIPEDNVKAPSASASTDADGRFILGGSAGKGAVPGKYRVTVKPYGSTPVIPAKYQDIGLTKLRVTIPEAGDADLQLKLVD